MLKQLLLITQLHRSGGTLFSQLLDGHSAIQAHPHELFIGRPNKWNWPNLTEILLSPELVFESLLEEKIAELGRQGTFIKPGSNIEAKRQNVPFTYSLEIHREDFCTLYKQAPVKTSRVAIQLYLKSFFNAWPEYKGSGSERYVSCFLPHLILDSTSLKQLFSDYPDVFLISLLRRPDSWIASLANHISLDLNNQVEVQTNLDRWKASVERMLALHRNPAVHSFSTSYEALVSNTPGEVKRFCDVAGIIFEPTLLMPTVGGYPVLPNSSYERAQTGVNLGSLSPTIQLPEDVTALLQDGYLPIYKKAAQKLGVPIVN